MTDVRTYSFVTTDVFTDRAFGGNQLAVLPDARGLSTAEMQSIAREFNYSETTFVLPPDDPAHAKKVRIFTPAAELPFAGHPTIGTAFVLAELGEVPTSGAETTMVLEEGAGPVPVLVRRHGGLPPFMQLTAPAAPEFRPGPGPEIAAELLALAPDLVVEEPSAPVAASCGLPFLVVFVRDRVALARAGLAQERWDRLMAESWAKGVLVCTSDASEPGIDFGVRMFSPQLAGFEDPATGSAACALGALLARHDRSGATSLAWTLSQGVEMGRPSRLVVEADRDGGAITAVRVGGSAVLVTRGEIRVPGPPADG